MITALLESAGVPRPIDAVAEKDVVDGLHERVWIVRRRNPFLIPSDLDLNRLFILLGQCGDRVQHGGDDIQPVVIVAIAGEDVRRVDVEAAIGGADTPMAVSADENSMCSVRRLLQNREDLLSHPDGTIVTPFGSDLVLTLGQVSPSPKFRGQRRKASKLTHNDRIRTRTDEIARRRHDKHTGEDLWLELSSPILARSSCLASRAARTIPVGIGGASATPTEAPAASRCSHELGGTGPPSENRSSLFGNPFIRIDAPSRSARRGMLLLFP